MKALWNFLNYFVFLYPLYMSFVWCIGALIFFIRRERVPFPKLPLASYPFFSIVIPARNEEENIARTVNALQNIDYPGYEVIVVDDGSKDSTGKILDALTKKHQWLKAIHLKPNSGKAKAINAGVILSKGELILMMDADCFLEREALKAMAWHFVASPRVGGVTGNPRIINRSGLLGKVQVGEYSSIIGLIKRTQRILGKVLTVSGVIAAFRRSAIVKCGLFDSDTVTEDIDMTWKLERRFWDVRFEPRALCWILAPETLSGLWKQRLRWAQGGVEVIKKHFDIWFSWKQRRFWPVYIEYTLSIFWSFALGFLVTSWIVGFGLYLVKIIPMVPKQPFIPPAWTGSILALMCLIQSFVSLYIDSHYERGTLLRYYYWVIWYPFFYWSISAVAIFFGVFNVFVIKKHRVTVIWESPDRGLKTRG